MRIMAAGGGTLGSVSPLIAIIEALRKETAVECLWIGTRFGPEKDLITRQDIPFHSIAAAKFPRYIHFKTLLQPFLFVLGCWQAWRVIYQFKPDLIITAGGFVAVPVVWMGWLRGIDCLVHQQDMLPGLANKLMVPFARWISVTFEKSLNDFPRHKTKLIGNPVRSEVLMGDKVVGHDFFQLDSSVPVLLVFGGGTGALALNTLIDRVVARLVEFCQVIHITGGKGVSSYDHPRYKLFKSLGSELALAYAVSTVVVSRGGMSAITELAACHKAAILIPMPRSHQEDNVAYIQSCQACVALDQTTLTEEQFVQVVKNLLIDTNRQMALQKNIAAAINTQCTVDFVDLLLKK